jgi:hypothetical protein
MRRRASVLAVSLAALAIVALGLAMGASAKVDELTVVRSVTSRFHSLAAATAAGYEPFYRCTEQPGVGTMGQHYVKFSLVGDPAVDPLQPEALVYEPNANGGYLLVALEWVRVGPEVADAPTVLGVEMRHVPSGNRYGIEPDGFYQRHLWLYDRNPAGLFADWNPTVSCHGTGDGGG